MKKACGPPATPSLKSCSHTLRIGIVFFPLKIFKLLCFMIPVIWRENKAVINFLEQNCYAYTPVSEQIIASGLRVTPCLNPQQESPLGGGCLGCAVGRSLLLDGGSCGGVAHEQRAETQAGHRKGRERMGVEGGQGGSTEAPPRQPGLFVLDSTDSPGCSE